MGDRKTEAEAPRQDTQPGRGTLGNRLRWGQAAAHLHPAPRPSGFMRPARPDARVLRDGNVESALYCPTAALQQLQVSK